MTRLFAWIGIPYLSALTAAVAFGGPVAGVLGIGFLVAFGISILVRSLRQTRRLPVVLLAIAAAFGSFFGQYSQWEPTLSALDGQTVLVTGRVCELPEHRYNRFYYLLEVEQVQTEQGEIIKEIGKIRVSAQNALDIGLYDTLEGMVGVSRPKDSDGFSSRSSYLAKGVTLSGFLYEYEGYAIEPADSYPPYYYALRMREELLDSLRTMLPPYPAEVLVGAILGQTGALDEGIQEDFRTVGISHILAVSGLHLTMISQLFLKVVRVFRIPKRVGIALAMAGIFCFMALTGFPSSVLRSGIMLLLYLGGQLLRRRVDSLNSLGFAVFCLCAVNPYAAADLGLLLSFSATLGLQVFPPVARQFFFRKWGDGFGAWRHSTLWLRRWIALGAFWLWSSFASTAGAVLFTLPITVLVFGEVSLIAPLSNLLLAFPSALFIQIGFVAGILHWMPVFSVVSFPLALLAGFCAKVVCWAAHGLAQLPFASVPASFGFVVIWLAAALFLFGCAFLLFRRKLPFAVVSVLSSILLLLGILSHQQFYQSVVRVAVLDVGDGICVVVSEQGHAIVLGCDGYSSVPLLRYLKSQSISWVDMLQLTDHSDEELENAAQILSSYPTGLVLLRQGEYFGGALQRSLAEAENHVYYREKSKVSLWSRVQVSLQGTYEECGIRLSVDGVEFLLLPETADITSGSWWDADVVILEGIPQKGGRLQPFFTVLSMDSIEEPVLKQDWPDSTQAYLTAGQGHIVLECSGREVTIRREN